MEHVNNMLQDAAEEVTEDDQQVSCKNPAISEIDPSTLATVKQAPALILCVPAHDETDELSACMLAILFKRQGMQAMAISSRMLSSDRLDRIEEMKPSAICISVLPPFAAFHARHSVRRIHERFPKLKIIVGYWSAENPPQDFESRCKTAGAQLTVKTLKRAIEELSPSGYAKKSAKTAP
jgi:hypothetical protein